MPSILRFKKERDQIIGKHGTDQLCTWTLKPMHIIGGNPYQLPFGNRDSFSIDNNLTFTRHTVKQFGILVQIVRHDPSVMKPPSELQDSTLVFLLIFHLIT